MQRILPLNTSVSTTLNGSGNGTVKLGPETRDQLWTLTVAAVFTSTANEIPQCSLFMGPTPTPDNFIDGTYTGNLNSSTNVATLPLTAGNYIWAVWSGGDPGATATLSLMGSITVGQGG